MKRGRSLVGIGALLAALACQGSGPADTRTGPRIALVLKTPNNPFFIDIQRGAEAAADSRPEPYLPVGGNGR